MNTTNLAFKDDEHYTYADYKAWELKPGERYELIDGIAYAMSAPSERHQLISVFLTLEFGNFLKGKPCKVIHAPYDVRLFYEEDESDDTVVQPDLVVICDPKKRGKEGCRGAPELVVEILSPSNSAEEMSRKLRLYEDAGVGEYWVVDPENKTVRVRHRENGSFGAEAVSRVRTPLYLNGARPPQHPKTAASRLLPGLEISLEAMFAES
jgi:Uma2 family endonuclease